MYLIFYFLSVLELLFYLRVIRGSYLRVIWNPIKFFALSWLFLYVALPLLIVVTGRSFYGVQYDITAFVTVKLFTMWFGIVTVLFGQRMRPREKMVNLSLIRASSSRVYVGVAILIGVLTLYYMGEIMAFGLADYLRNRIKFNRGKGIYTLLIFSNGVYLSYLYLMRIAKGKKISMLLFLSSLLLVSVFLVLGSRLNVFLYLLQLFLLYVVVKQPSKSSIRKMLLIPVPLLVIFMTWFGYYRVRLDSTERLGLGNNLSDEIIDNLIINFGKFENLLWLFSNRDKWSLNYGDTFLAALTNFVPRSLWYSKPLGGGPLLKNTMNPGSYDLVSDNVSSYTTGLLTEIYMSFGMFGLLISPFIYGYILARYGSILSRFAGKQDAAYTVLYIYGLVSYAFVLNYGEFLGVTTRVVFVFVSVILFNRFGNKSLVRNER